jgi:2-keto-4-pentenoate hydratase
LHRHWRDGTKLQALDASERPHGRTEAYAIQAELEHTSKAPLFGWKIAATSEAGQRHINVTGPMAGRILAETVIADGGTASMAGNGMRVAEPEFAFRMAEDLPPRAAPFSVAEVLDAVGTLHPAIEIPDSRFVDFVTAGEAQLIADNACAHRFVLGAATTADWRSRDLVEQRPVTTLGGKQYVGHGKNVLGDPRVALTWLANELRALGLTLRAGQVVTTGTCHPPLPIKAGDHVAADFGVLGNVSVGFR